MERRKFLQDSCKACLLIGAGLLIKDLTACSPASQVMRLPISDYSVRVPVSAFTKKSMIMVRPAGWVYDIALRKEAGGQYQALFLQCTHQKNQVMADGSGFLCTLHGSRYTIDGQVKKGPAERALKKFPVREEGGELIIQLNS